MRTKSADATPLAVPSLVATSIARALIELTKPRLAVMSVLTTAVAYHVAGRDHDAGTTCSVLGGTLLSAAGALGLNQWYERRTDSLMRRTSSRPLPEHRLAPQVALLWTAALGIAGVLWLALAVNVAAAAISALTIVLYAFVYTPLKRRTRWATEIGAVSGALPPLIGAAAATGTTTASGVFLAVLIFAWQMPHFFAIGWACRHDYRAARLPLLPAVDRTGRATALACCIYSVLLLAVAVGGWRLGTIGPAGGFIATTGAFVMLGRSLEFLRAAPTRDAAARRLFLTSLAFLPAVLLAMMV